MQKNFIITICFIFIELSSFAQGTRLLRQPTISDTEVAFTYGGDIWVTNLQNQQTLRLTSTGAVESNPIFSPDGKTIAFTSNRSGSSAVYIVPADGGTPTRLTWNPAPAKTCGWTPDGEKILYSSTRETAPSGYGRLWTVSKNGGPSTLLTQQWGANGSFSPDGKKIVLDKITRWDVEWRAYRGGQNTPLIILNLDDLSELLLPNEKQTDTNPVWLNETIYFLSDRDWTTNIWSYSPDTKELHQVTNFSGSEVKSFSAKGNKIVFERDGYINLIDLTTKQITQLNIEIKGDFPWAETKWEDVSSFASSASLSPSGKRAIMEARGEI